MVQPGGPRKTDPTYSLSCSLCSIGLLLGIKKFGGTAAWGCGPRRVVLLLDLLQRGAKPLLDLHLLQ